jgi:hypothetical protein
MQNFLKLMMFFYLVIQTVPANASKYIEYYCHDEVKLHCPGRKDFFQCAKKIPDAKKSKICKAALTSYQKELNGFYGPCVNDKANTCMDLEPGMGQIQPCLDKIAPFATPACQQQIAKAYISKFDDLPFDMQVVCANDLKQFCEKVPYGKSQKTNCLAAKFGKLKDADCKAALAPAKQLLDKK